MKLAYSVKELQAVPIAHDSYGTALRILARLGALEVDQPEERKEKLEREVTELVSTLYLAKVGDEYCFENRKTGIRYKGTVIAVEPSGRMRGTPMPYYPEYDLLIDVQRDKKNIYRW